MKNKILGIVIILAMLGCSSNTERNKVPKQLGYPKLVDSLGIQSLYDKTKWTLYCIYCDKVLEFQPQFHFEDTVTFGSLDLRFDTLIVSDHTVELNFLFYYNDSLPCNSNLVRNSIASGMVYLKGSDSAISYSSPSTARYFRHECDDYNKCPDRFVKPLQPEVITYLKMNKTKVNMWFYEEAKRRGII